MTNKPWSDHLNKVLSGWPYGTTPLTGRSPGYYHKIEGTSNRGGDSKESQSQPRISIGRAGILLGTGKGLPAPISLINFLESGCEIPQGLKTFSACRQKTLLKRVFRSHLGAPGTCPSSSSRTTHADLGLVSRCLSPGIYFTVELDSPCIPQANTIHESQVCKGHSCN